MSPRRPAGGTTAGAADRWSLFLSPSPVPRGPRARDSHLRVLTACSWADVTFQTRGLGVAGDGARCQVTCGNLVLKLVRFPSLPGGLVHPQHLGGPYVNSKCILVVATNPSRVGDRITDRPIGR